MRWSSISVLEDLQNDSHFREKEELDCGLHSFTSVMVAKKRDHHGPRTCMSAREPTPVVADHKMVGVNDATVWAFMSIGCGFSSLEESFSIFGVPAMSKGAFLRREEAFGQMLPCPSHGLYPLFW